MHVICVTLIQAKINQIKLCVSIILVGYIIFFPIFPFQWLYAKFQLNSYPLLSVISYHFRFSYDPSISVSILIVTLSLLLFYPVLIVSVSKPP